ncbi:MAG: 16S rRNA processing protein RimM [Candidatus Mycalebacterium zealandia]|nr:MAG: 16S rRNA processing protein RimM [Candidatus Mycalebacterium zealandia]
MRLIDYGKIAKSHGLEGGLEVIPFSGETSSLKKLRRVFIKSSDSSEPHSFEITGKIVREKDVVLKLSGVNTRDDAQKFAGSTVMVALSDLPGTGEGEYYNFQLIGLEAVGEDGEKIGRVLSLVQSGMQSVLVISLPDGGEILVPMVEKFIAGVDIEKGTVAVQNTEALKEKDAC